MDAQEMIIEAIILREVSSRVFFTDPDESKLLRVFADDLCWLAEQQEIAGGSDKL